MIINIKVIGQNLREESAIEMIHNCVDISERGMAQGNEFNFQIGSSPNDGKPYRAWKILKAISDILEIKP